MLVVWVKNGSQVGARMTSLMSDTLLRQPLSGGNKAFGAIPPGPSASGNVQTHYVHVHYHMNPLTPINNIPLIVKMGQCYMTSHCILSGFGT